MNRDHVSVRHYHREVTEKEEEGNVRNVWYWSGHHWWNIQSPKMERAEKTELGLPFPPSSRNTDPVTPQQSAHSGHFTAEGLCDRAPSESLAVSVSNYHFVPHFLFSEVSRQGEREGAEVTLELVELLGHCFLGGTALAAAGFFPSEFTRLMHALRVWGFSGSRGFQGHLEQECLQIGLHTGLWWTSGMLCNKGIFDHFCKIFHIKHHN